MINRKAILELAKEFASKCDANDIWYSLDRKTLLGSYVHGGFVPWHIKFEVFVEVGGFIRLTQLFRHRIVEGHFDKAYKGYTASFVQDRENWKEDQPFIQIRVAIPTDTKRVHKHEHRKFLTHIFQKEDNIKTTINKLYLPSSYEGFYLPYENNKDRDVWIQAFNKEREIVNFSGILVKRMKNTKKLLSNWYGNDSLQRHIVPSAWYEYPAPNKKDKVV